MTRDALQERLCEGCPLPRAALYSGWDTLCCLREQTPDEYFGRDWDGSSGYLGLDYQTPEGTVIRLLELEEDVESCGECPVGGVCDMECEPARRLYVLQIYVPHEQWLGYGRKCEAKCWFRPLGCIRDRASARKRMKLLAEKGSWREIGEAEEHEWEEQT